MSAGRRPRSFWSRLLARRAGAARPLPASVGEMLQRVSVDGVPNMGELHLALRNLDAVNLNLKFYGYELARRLANALPRREQTSAGHVGLACKASTQADMESDWVAHWTSELHVPVVFHRKLWELSYLLQALHENGLLVPGARGLGFGCGEEPIPSYLASRGIHVTVTDLAADAARAAGWAATGQAASSSIGRRSTGWWISARST